jgi:cardiolipin synthase A/B
MGGFFIYEVVFSTHPALPSKERPVILYANQMGQDLKLVLCRAISQAKGSIYASFYGVTDPHVIAHLEKKAQHHVGVHMIYDPTSSSALRSTYMHLSPMHGPGLMHRKILCIDTHMALIGSANATPSSLRMHDNMILGLYHPECTQFFSSCGDNRGEFVLGDQRVSCFLLPESADLAIERLCFALDQAKEKIHIALFTFTHPQIGQTLIRAKERGVSVHIALDATSARGASRSLAKTLADAGIEIRVSLGQELFHHKWALIDGEEFILGSANWTKAAFGKNKDLLVFLSPLTKSQKTLLNTLWKRIENDTFPIL